MATILGTFSNSARAERELDIFRDPIVGYVNSIPGILIRSGYTKVGGVRLKKISKRLATIHYFDDPDIQTTTGGGSRLSGRYSSSTFDGYGGPEVHLNLARLVKLYGVPNTRYFVFHEALGALRYHDENYRMSAYLADLVERVIQKKNPTQSDLARTLFAREGGTHAGGGGDAFGFMTKEWMYSLNEVSFTKLTQEARQDASARVDSYLVEMNDVWAPTEFLSADRSAESVSQRVLQDLLAAPMHCPNLKDVVEIDREEHLALLRREVIESPRFDPKSRELLAQCAARRVNADIYDELTR